MYRWLCLLLACASLAPAQSYRDKMLTSQLEQDPQNLALILHLASVKLEEASGIIDENDRAAHLDEVQVLYLRANSVDPTNVEALYRLGVVSWMKVFPAVVTARRVTAMDPETPGPIRNSAERAVLNGKYRGDLQYAIATLEQAIALDPTRNDAMSYLQMAYRARADFQDTRLEWDGDQSTANRWRETAFTVGSAKKTSAVCPAGLHVVGSVPPVTLAIKVGLDGRATDLQFQDGPSELAAAAIETARKWTFPLDQTTVEVPFQPCP